MKDYILITGATSGIGYETAKAFAQRGKNLIIVARREDRLNDLKAEILKLNSSLDIIVKLSDLSKKEDVIDLYSSLKNYHIGTWINNAGFGFDNILSNQDIENLSEMVRLNVEAVALLSTLYVKDYKDVEAAQLLNVASVVGYFIIPKTVSYAATKFFVTAFTEGLDRELKDNNHKLRAKVLAPAATKTEFTKIASQAEDSFVYEDTFAKFHTAAQMAGFLVKLYDSDKSVGIVNLETYEFELKTGIHPSF